MRSHWVLTLPTILSSLLAMVLPMTLVRILTPSEVGQFRIFFLYLLLAPSVTLTSGLITGLYYWCGRVTQRDSVLRSAWSLVVVASSCFCLGALLLHEQLRDALHWQTGPMVAFILIIPMLLISNFIEHAIIAGGRIRLGAFYSTGFDLLRTISVLVCAWMYRDLNLIFWLYLTFFSLKAVTGLFLMIQMKLLDPRLDFSNCRKVLDYALPVSCSSAFGIVSRYSDRLILSSFLSPASFALYATGCLSIPPLDMIEQSVNRILLPKLSGALESGDRKLASELCLRAQSDLYLVFFPAASGLFIFAEPIVELLFTRNYLGAAPFLRWYAVSYLMLSIPHDLLQRASGNGKWIFRTCVSFSLISIPLVLVLTHIHGAMGALAAMLISQGLLRIYGGVSAKRLLGWRWRELFAFGEAFRLLSLCVVLALGCLALESSFESSLHWLATCGPLFTVAFFSTMGAIRLRPWLQQRWHRRRLAAPTLLEAARSSPASSGTDP